MQKDTLALQIIVWPKPLKKYQFKRGYDLREYCLTIFGGAAGQHACSIAEILDMKTCLIHPHASVLSAYGMGLAEVRTNKSMIIEKYLTRETLLESALIADSLITSTTEILEKQNVSEKNITYIIKLFIKLDGTDTSLDFDFDTITNLQIKFKKPIFVFSGSNLHQKNYYRVRVR